MKYDPDIHHRRSIRLREYDYSSAGAYFVTICTQGRECLFGEVVDGVMQLSRAGRMVSEWWLKLPGKFPGVALDEYMIMPNHFHGIIMINDGDTVGAIHELPLHSELTPHDVQRQQRRTMLIPKIVGYFKMNTAKNINLMRDNPGVPVWQRNYYERVIRDERELDAARKYIAENPIKWDLDRENPVNVPHPTHIVS